MTFYAIRSSKTLSLFQLESVKIDIPMPKAVLNCTLTATQGKYAFDPVSKLLSWDVGKVDGQKSNPNIRGSVILVILSIRYMFCNL